MSSEPVLLVRGLRKTFGSEGSPVRAFRGIDLEVARGEFVAVMGHSGCGKSTLLNLVAGLEIAERGEMVLAGSRRWGKSESELPLSAAATSASSSNSSTSSRR